MALTPEINKALATVNENTSMLTSLLKSSIAKEENAKKAPPSTVTVLQGFVCKWLDEFEGAWDNDETCASPEIARDYLDQAKFMESYFGRNNNRIEGVQKWYNNYLPFGPKN